MLNLTKKRRMKLLHNKQSVMLYCRSTISVVLLVLLLLLLLPLWSESGWNYWLDQIECFHARLNTVQ